MGLVNMVHVDKIIRKASLLLFFFLISFSASSARSCPDYFYLSTYDKFSGPQNFFDGKINYSQAYITVPFLDEFKPGIYIITNYVENEVYLYAYIDEMSKNVHIYMEPRIGRFSINTFYPCIDKHVMKNVNYFKTTCLKQKKLNMDNVYSELAEYVNGKVVEFGSYCFDKNSSPTTILLKKRDGEIRYVNFSDLPLQNPYFKKDPIFKKLQKIDSLVRETVDENAEKCNWRNLVPNPAQFSEKKYHSSGYIYLNKKECPEL